MTYWHMQLHPDDKYWGKEKELLKEKNLIGIGEEWPGGESQINQFINEMKIDDIVLIKCGARPIALVQVVGELEDIKKNNISQIDWFQFRRKIKILEILNENRYNFPSPRGTLKKSINEYTLTYQYIDDWYKTIQYKVVRKGIKLKSLFIKNYKQLKNFNINFIGENTLSIVVLAGKNGTGKTTVLDWIYEEHNLTIGAFFQDNESYIKLEHYGNDEIINKEAKKRKKELDDYIEIEKKKTGMVAISYDSDGLFLDDLKKHIIYIPARTPNKEEIESIDKLILEYVDYFIYDQSLTAAVGYENLQNDIDEIFEGFGLSFQFKRVDSKNKKALFEPYVSSSDDIEFNINSLSTGEKTLLFKVLNLYLQKAKNKIILIDEPELSLHPHWQNRVLQVYEKFAEINNNQIIIATHSPHIIANTPHKYLRLLVEEEGKIVAKALDSTPLDRDLNTIIKTVMGADYIPKWLEEKHFAYRKLCEDGKEDSDEAKKLKSEILEYESPNSSFFQGLAFDMELMR